MPVSDDGLLKGTVQYMLKKNLRPNKIHVFWVTQPYLNLLTKPRFFFRFSGKCIILCILKGTYVENSSKK